jgi:hypothetical protein
LKKSSSNHEIENQAKNNFENHENENLTAQDRG